MSVTRRGVVKGGAAGALSIALAGSLDGGETKSHGWVFEVDPHGRRTEPVPLTGLGRFAHEAVAVDPHTSVAYLTEDASRPFGLFFRSSSSPAAASTARTTSPSPRTAAA